MWRKKPPLPRVVLVVKRSPESAPQTGFYRVAEGSRRSDGKLATRTLVDGFYQRLSSRAATLDEIFSDAFDAPGGGASHAARVNSDLVERRLAAWRRSSAAGDPGLFARRLQRDDLSPAAVEHRLATAERRA